jgi:N-acetylmuramoyl-L-alanine amidase
MKINRKFLLLQSSLLGFYAMMHLQPAQGLNAPTAELNNWRYNLETQQLEITLSAGVTPGYFYLPQPPRLVVDFPNTKLGNVSTRENYPGKIQRIRFSQLTPNVTRIVFDLTPETPLDQLQLLPQQNHTRWSLHPYVSHPSNSAPASQLAPLPSSVLPPSINVTTNSPQPFIIVPPLNSPVPNSNTASSPTKILNTTVSPVTKIPVIEFGQPLPHHN